jgi:conjugative transfer signal peptidase TraF
MSGSMPVGVYYTFTDDSPVKKGDTVTVILPDNIQAFGVKRGFLKNMKTMLLKEIIAVPGDNVKLTEKELTVNGKRYLAPVHKYDSLHRKIEHIKESAYIETDGYWLYGSGNPDDSWDSRYFGPVKKENIVKKAIGILNK